VRSLRRHRRAAALFVELDDVITEQLDQVLHTRNAHRQREIEFGKNFPEQPGFAQSRRDEHEHGAIF